MSTESRTPLDGRHHDRDAYGQVVRPDGLLVLDGVANASRRSNDLSFAVNVAEDLGFIGPKRAGKSTTFNCVTGGLFPPTEGTVWYDGDDVTGTATHSANRPSRARCRPRSPIVPVLDNVTLGAHARQGVPRSPDSIMSPTDRAPERSERVGPGDRARRLALGASPRPACSGSNWAGLAPDLAARRRASAGLLTGRGRPPRLEEGLTLVVDHNMRGLLLTSRWTAAVVADFGAKLAEGTPDNANERDSDLPGRHNTSVGSSTGTAPRALKRPTRPGQCSQ